MGECWGSWMRLKSLQVERPRGPSPATSSPAFQPSKISIRRIPIPQARKLTRSSSSTLPTIGRKAIALITHGFTDQSNANYHHDLSESKRKEPPTGAFLTPNKREKRRRRALIERSTKLEGLDGIKWCYASMPWSSFILT